MPPEQQAIKYAQSQDAKFSVYGDMLNNKAFDKQVQSYRNSKAGSISESGSKALDQQITKDQIDNLYLSICASTVAFSWFKKKCIHASSMCNKRLIQFLMVF